MLIFKKNPYAKRNIYLHRSVWKHPIYKGARLFSDLQGFRLSDDRNSRKFGDSLVYFASNFSKLLKLEIVKETKGIGRAKLYMLNKENQIVKDLIEIDNRIMKHFSEIDTKKEIVKA